MPTIPLLTTHRPGYDVRWGDEPYYTEIVLHLLTEQEAGAILSRL